MSAFIYPLSTTDHTNVILNNWSNTASSSYSTSYITIGVDSKEDEDGRINPILYFKYVKSKFNLLERIKLEKRLKSLKNAFDKASENGQKVLAKKFLKILARETKELTMAIKGIKYYIEEEDLHKYKHKIKGGHISDTPYTEYTRVIPDHVVKKFKQFKDLFDDLIIYHYWNEKALDTKKMDREERAKMRDPILFGKIKETERLYFIADWEDEYCDLTFDKLIGFLGKDKRQKITDKPILE